MHLQAFMYRSWAQLHNDLTQLKLNPKYFRQIFKVQTSLSEVLKAKYIVLTYAWIFTSIVFVRTTQQFILKNQGKSLIMKFDPGCLLKNIIGNCPPPKTKSHNDPD